VKRRELLALLGGTVALHPLAASAQQAGRVYTIALVYPPVPAGDLTDWPAWREFFAELRRLGYIEGRNLSLRRYSGEDFGDLARTVANAKPDAIFVLTDELALKVKAAAETIPIVAGTGDPVFTGLVPSLTRQGGNVTGIVGNAGPELLAKRLQLLREAVPTASRVGFLALRAAWDYPNVVAAREAAGQAGIELLPGLFDPPAGEAEYRRVFALLVQQRADALIVADAWANYAYERLILAFAENGRLPALFPHRDFVEQGGLMSYGVDYSELFRRAAGYLDQVLKGTKPGDIPFYQATRWEFVVNLKTAKALGLTVPQSLLARADEVIE